MIKASSRLSLREIVLTTLLAASSACSGSSDSSPDSSLISYAEEAPDIYYKKNNALIARYADRNNDNLITDNEIYDLLGDVAGHCDLKYFVNVSYPNFGNSSRFVVATGNLVEFPQLGISFASGKPGEEPTPAPPAPPTPLTP